MKKRYIVICLVLCSVLVMCVLAFGDSKTMEVQSLSSLPSYEKESISVEKYNILMREWAFDPDYISDTNADFPEFYGGAYINEDKLFVIQVTNPFEEARAYFSDLIDLTDVAFERVQYSFVELKEAQDEIEQVIHSVGISSFEDYNGIGISSTRNKVIVSFGSKSSASKAARMSGLSGSDIVEFVDIDDFVEAEA